MNTAPDPRSEAAAGYRPLPATAAEIHDAAVEVQRLRSRGLTWRQVSERTGFSRVDSLQLAHNLFRLTDAAYEAAKHDISTGVWFERRSA